MQEILKLKPIFHERIWGGTKLREYFNYHIPSDTTGECWAISAHENGDCLVENGPLKGQSLSNIYANHRELFGRSKSPVFPLLTKILDAKMDLSVQVHPDDEHARKEKNDLGKTECWYIIDCDEDAQIIYGHTAKTRKELNHMIDEGEWEHLLERINIKPGDFFYVPSGTIHALCKGTLVLETQQSSDVTYRVYDYNRTDEKGLKRELHIDQAKNVLTVQHDESNIAHEKVSEGGIDITKYISSPYFTVEKWGIKGKGNKKLDEYTLFSVIDGEGKVNDVPMTKGDHFILTSVCKEVNLEGEMEMIVSWIDSAMAEEIDK